MSSGLSNSMPYGQETGQHRHGYTSAIRDEPHPQSPRVGIAGLGLAMSGDRVPPTPALPSLSHEQQPTSTYYDSANLPQRSRPNSRRRTEPSESFSVSVSSEDPDGAHVPHDARPDAVPTARPDTRARARWTQSTMGISTHYPQSSSDMTATESSSDPSTPVENASLDPNYGELADPDPAPERPYFLDPNDVSYRLRLLVKNNYYLPPAHSKPRQAPRVVETAPSSPLKSSPSNFRDIFRIGGSRSQSPRQPPLSPLSGVRPSLGVRRVPSDAPSSPSNLLPPPPRRAVSADIVSENERKGRVVVIRERLDDGPDEQEPDLDIPQLSSATPLPLTHMIDPTEVVDLPAYAFEPQASLGNILGSTSIGAAALAEFAPSPSTGARAMSPQDEAWRRALLLEAVDHSMSSIPDVDRSRSSRSQQSIPPSATQTPQSHSISQPSSMPPAVLPSTKPLSSSNAKISSSRRNSRHSTNTRDATHTAAFEVEPIELSTRAHTANLYPTIPSPILPRVPTTLPPPPRRKKSNANTPFHDPLEITTVDPGHDAWQTVRKTLSTPLLSERVSTAGDVMENIPTILSTGDTLESLSTASNYSEEDEENVAHSGNRVSKDASTFISDRRSYATSYRSHMSSAFGTPDFLMPEAGPSRPSSFISALAARRTQSPPSHLAFEADRRIIHNHGVMEEESRTPTTNNHSHWHRPRSKTVSDILPPSPVSPMRGASSLHNSSVISLDHPPSPGLRPQLFDSFDRTKPLTNTPSSSSRYFTPRAAFSSKHSPRIPESTFELLKHGINDEDHTLSSLQNLVPEPDTIGGRVRAQTFDTLGNERHDGGLGNLLKLHIEAERDHIRRIAASNMR